MYLSLVSLSNPPAPLPLELSTLKSHVRLDSSDTTEDANLALYFLAARQAVAARLKQTLTTTQYQLTIDTLPGSPLEGPSSSVGLNTFLNSSVYPWTLGQAWRLPAAPLISVESVDYLDTSSNWQTLDPSFYNVVPGFPGRISPAYGKIWPFTLPQVGSVRISYTAGYGSTTTVVSIASGITTTTTTTTRPGLLNPIVTTTTAATQSVDVVGTTMSWNIPFSVQAAILLWAGSLFKTREAVADGVKSEIPLGVKDLLASAFKGAYR